MANTRNYIIAAALCLALAGTAHASCSADSACQIETLTIRQSGKNQTLIEWAVNDLSKADFFRVEKSTDGTEFSPLTIIKTSDGRYRYHCVDDQSTSGAERFYRVIQVNTDGSETPSAVVKFRINGFTGKLALSPNPAHDQVNFQMNGAEKGLISLTVFNQSGLLVRQWMVNKQEENLTQNLDINALPEGNYILQVKWNTQSESMQFIKAK